MQLICNPAKLLFLAYQTAHFREFCKYAQLFNKVKSKHEKQHLCFSRQPTHRCNICVFLKNLWFLTRILNVICYWKGLVR